MRLLKTFVACGLFFVAGCSGPPPAETSAPASIGKVETQPASAAQTPTAPALSPTSSNGSAEPKVIFDQEISSPDGYKLGIQLVKATVFTHLETKTAKPGKAIPMWWFQGAGSVTNRTPGRDLPEGSTVPLWFSFYPLFESSSAVCQFFKSNPAGQSPVPTGKYCVGESFGPMYANLADGGVLNWSEQYGPGKAYDVLDLVQRWAVRRDMPEPDARSLLDALQYPVAYLLVFQGSQFKECVVTQALPGVKCAT